MLKRHQIFIEYPEIDKYYHKYVKSCNNAMTKQNNDLLQSQLFFSKNPSDEKGSKSFTFMKKHAINKLLFNINQNIL